MNHSSDPEADSGWDDLAKELGLEPDETPAPSPPEGLETEPPIEAPEEESSEHEPVVAEELPCDEGAEIRHDVEPPPAPATVFDPEGDAVSLAEAREGPAPDPIDEASDWPDFDAEPDFERLTEEPVPEELPAELADEVSEWPDDADRPDDRTDPRGGVEELSEVRGPGQIPNELDPASEALIESLFGSSDRHGRANYPSRPLPWPSDEDISREEQPRAEAEVPELLADLESEAEVEARPDSTDDAGGKSSKKRRRRRRGKKREDETEVRKEAEEPAAIVAPESESEIEIDAFADPEEVESSAEFAGFDEADDDDDDEGPVEPVGDWNLPTWDDLIASLNRS